MPRCSARSVPKGILINMARGSVVDEPALIKALQDKTILSAGLDVYAREPEVPPELIAMDHVVLVPPSRLGLGRDPREDGPAGGGQPAGLGGGQAAADAGAGNAVAAEKRSRARVNSAYAGFASLARRRVSRHDDARCA